MYLHRNTSTTRESTCIALPAWYFPVYIKCWKQWYKSELSRWSLLYAIKSIRRFLFIGFTYCEIVHAASVTCKQFRDVVAHNLGLSPHQSNKLSIVEQRHRLREVTKRYQRAVDANFLGERNRAKLLPREKKRSQREERSHDPIGEHLTPSRKLRKIKMKRCHWKRSVIVERMGVIGTRTEREKDYRRKREAER